MYLENFGLNSFEYQTRDNGNSIRIYFLKLEIDWSKERSMYIDIHIINWTWWTWSTASKKVPEVDIINVTIVDSEWLGDWTHSIVAVQNNGSMWRTRLTVGDTKAPARTRTYCPSSGWWTTVKISIAKHFYWCWIKNWYVIEKPTASIINFHIKL